jgi:hypothetical protein
VVFPMFPRYHAPNANFCLPFGPIYNSILMHFRDSEEKKVALEDLRAAVSVFYRII